MSHRVRLDDTCSIPDGYRQMNMRPFASRPLVIASGIIGASLLAAAVMANDYAPPNGVVSAEADPHAHHHMATSTTVRRSEGQYATPDVKLVRDDGKTVSLPAELDDGRPVVLNFIYTSCTSICPLTSQVFEQLQKRIANSRDPIHLMSISIDPEQDTPARLREYAKQFDAAPGWDHYTGTMAASIAVQQAFNAYRGDKMSHAPLTLLRARPGKPWIRIDGFASADDLLAERKLWSIAPAALVAR
ncbi:MAG TPA: SCO family protein [Steroidobacteraceae bacterium]|jgi:protein SCO1/2|nr:SCO family protein [Steroidobacteraceae bacterium]